MVLSDTDSQLSQNSFFEISNKLRLSVKFVKVIAFSFFQSTKDKYFLPLSFLIFNYTKGTEFVMTNHLFFLNIFRVIFQSANNVIIGFFQPVMFKKFVLFRLFSASHIFFNAFLLFLYLLLTNGPQFHPIKKKIRKIPFGLILLVSRAVNYFEQQK